MMCVLMKASFKRLMENLDELWLRYNPAAHHGTVRILHHDGSAFTLTSAAMMDDPEDERYLWVISEHQGEFVFAKDEVCFSAQYRKEKGNDIVYVPE